MSIKQKTAVVLPQCKRSDTLLTDIDFSPRYAAKKWPRQALGGALHGVDHVMLVYRIICCGYIHDEGLHREKQTALSFTECESLEIWVGLKMLQLRCTMRAET